MFYKLLISYLSVILVPVIIYLLFIQFRVLSYFEEQMSDFGSEKLEYTQRQVDNLYYDMLRMGMNISGLPVLDQLDGFSINSQYGADQAIAARSVMKAISEELAKTQEIHSIYVFLRSPDGTVITRSEVTSIADFDDTKWIDSYERRKERVSLLPIRSYGSASYHTGQFLTLVFPLNIYVDENQGLVAINVQRSVVEDYLSAIFAAGESLMIVDRASNVLFTSAQNLDSGEMDDPAIPLISQMQGSSGHFRVQGNQENILYTYLRSSSTGVIYVSAAPIKSLYSSIIFLRYTLILISVIILLIGIVISYLLSRRIAAPLASIVETIRTEIGLKQGEQSSELLVIERAIRKVIDQEKWLNNQEQTYRQQVKKSFVLGIFQDSYEETPSLKIEEQGACGIVVSVDRHDEFSQRYSDAEQRFFRALILHMFEESLQSRTSCHGILLPNNVILIAAGISAKDYKSPINFLGSCFEQLEAGLKKIENLTVSVGIGNGYDKTSGIKQSLAEATEALNRKLLKGHDSVTFFCEISRDSFSYFYPSDGENHLLNYLSLGLEDDLQRSVRELVLQVKNERNVSCSNVRQIFAHITGTIIRHVEMCHMNTHDIFRGADVFADLSRKETIDDIGIWLEDFVVAVLHFKAAHDLDVKRLAMRLADYIQSNINNPQLDITLISSHLNISYSYVRKLMMDNFGETFIDYVNRIRIERAKLMLAQTDTSIDSIAHRIGYGNAKSLTRYFRKYEGITPGRYRSIPQ